MKTKVIRMNPQELDMEGIREAGEILRQGGLVAFPTETVYGLGGNGLDPQASAKIYRAKGRPSDNPLIIHIADMEDLEKIVKEVPESAKKLASVYWPGPLTMIFQKSDIVPYETTGGMDTVGSAYAGSSAGTGTDPGRGRLCCGTKCQYIGSPESNDGFPCGRGSGWED